METSPHTATFRANVQRLEEAHTDVPYDWDLGEADSAPCEADELEAAYLRALQAAEAAQSALEIPEDVTAPTPGEEPSAAPGSAADPPPQADKPDTAPESAAPVRPEQVLEALLFVGGEPLTGRRLAELLGGGSMHEQVDELIVGLNARYVEEGRPYEIQLTEGGYKLVLREAFEPVRNRVYGLGPKEVRLSQDSLEILALIAYQQPVTRQALEATGKPNVAGLVRQLLRLELIALERGPGGKDDVSYRTTPRFLQVFALERLEDLPRAEDILFR